MLVGLASLTVTAMGELTGSCSSHDPAPALPGFPVSGSSPGNPLSPPREWTHHTEKHRKQDECSKYLTLPQLELLSHPHWLSGPRPH